MAIVSQAYSQHHFRLALAKQTAFGTRNSTEAEFIELHLTNRPELVSTVVEDNTKRADGSTVASVNDRYRTTAGGEYTIPIEGVLTKATAAYLMAGCYQILTSEGGTPYPKLFTLGTGVAVPSAPAFVFTVLIYDPSGKNIELQDCVIKNLTLAFSPGAAGGRVTFSGTLYSGTAPDTTSVAATPASWVVPGTDYYVMSALDTFTLGGNDMVAAGWSLTVDNGAKRFGFNAAGDAQGISIGAGTAGFAITGELVTKYDSASYAAYADFLANNTDSVAITYNASSSADLIFAINARYSGEPKKDFGGDAGVMINIPFEGVYSGATAALAVTVEDGIDRNW